MASLFQKVMAGKSKGENNTQPAVNETRETGDIPQRSTRRNPNESSSGENGY